MELKEIIKELSTIAGPSGSEHGVSSRVVELIKPYMDEVRTDAMGNVIGYKSCGKKGAKRLLLDAHIDEVGFIVTGIEEGFLKIAEIGSPDVRMLPASQVKVLTNPPIFGTVCCMPVHVLSNEEMNKAIKLEDMSVDIGLSDEDAKAAVPLGTPVVFASECFEMGSGALCGKAMDDRACMGTIIYALELIKDEKLDVDLIVMGSTQEELGFRGAVTGVFGAMPDYAVAVDVTFAKTPDYKKDDAMNSGGGAAIDIGPNVTRSLYNKLVSIAEEKEIPYQIEVCGGNSGTNAWVMQTSREGVPTAIISLPIKYMHSPIETLKLSDAVAVSELLSAFILKGGEL